MSQADIILAIDMSTDISSVALRRGEQVEQVTLEGPKPSRRVLNEADGLLQRAAVSLQDVDLLAFGRGPGAFTGLRVAAGIAQGLALGLEIPVVPVSSLAALAWRAFRETGKQRLLAVLDARMDEIYWAAIVLDADGALEFVAPEQLTPPAGLQVPEGEWLGVGPGWQAYPQLAGARGVSVHPGLIRPDAAAVAELAALAGPDAAVPVESAVPIYLRDTVAWKKAD